MLVDLERERHLTVIQQLEHVLGIAALTVDQEIEVLKELNWRRGERLRLMISRRNYVASRDHWIKEAAK